MRDRWLIYGSAFVRAAATSMVAVLLGLYLAGRGLDPFRIGLVVATGLAGAGAATAVVTLLGDRAGRRRALGAISFLSAAGLIALAWADDPWLMALAAFAGMVNAMGRDRGAALVLEQAALPATVPASQRTRAFAWYNVMQDAGHALGALAAALPGLGSGAEGQITPARFQAAFLVAAGVLGATAILYALLSRRVEAPAGAGRRPPSARTRRLVFGLGALFGVDGLGSGFLTTSLVSYLFFERFGTPPEWIAAMFFGARVLNAASHVGAAWLAARIGLVNTMVFTHLPSNLLLMTVAIAPDFGTACLLFLLREGLVEMDVPTRQSYVTAIVPPEDRTFASGVTGLTRLAAWAVAPLIAGYAMQRSGLMAPLVIGAGLKIAYDVALFAAFRRVRPPEEGEAASPGT